MGKKGWFYAMKKAVSPSMSKIKKEKRSQKSKPNPKNSWQGNEMCLDTCSSPKEAALASPFYPYHPINETDFKLPEDEQIIHVDTITYSTTVAEETTSHAAPEVKFMTSNSHFLGKTREEIGAIKIQAAYRGYMARRAFRSFRAMMRLNLWIQGQAIKHQTESTLMRIQTMNRVQSQVRARRTRMAQVNKTLKRQQKQKKLLDRTKKEAFDLSPRSKEQADAMLKSKKEATERREKALAYAHSRQQAWRNSQKPSSPPVVDPNHFDWRWNWSNRWDAIRPLETETTSSKVAVGGMVKRQSPPTSPLSKSQLSSGQRSKSANSKGSTKLLSSRLQVSKPGPIAKKCHLVTKSLYCGVQRSSIAVM